jgi:hypothetical protein
MPGDRDQLDRLVDWALATYADPGADSGLEDRVLRRIAAEVAPAPRRRWPAWAIALPFAASLLLIALLSRPWANHPSVMPQANFSRQLAGPSIEETKRLTARPAPVRGSATPLQEPHPRHKTLAAKSAPLPKLEIFPTPQPLSPEEQALVSFAARAAKPERESLIAAQQQAAAPLRIAAIEIKPLEPPAAGAN